MATGDRQVFCHADPVFFEMPDRWDRGAVPFAVAGRPVPAGWTRQVRGSWTHMVPPRRVERAQGWKIHVSAGPGQADAACAITWDHCITHDIPFKHLTSPEVFLAHNTKYAPRAASGKLLTVYPADDDQLLTVLTDLAEKLDGITGPRVLGDLQWPGSPLFVRYGGFAERYCTDDSGAVVHAVERPDGKLVPDRRLPVFTVPDWVSVPPFLAELVRARGSSVDFPYRVLKALHFSNAGGVYLAERESDGRTVVLKEARPQAALDLRLDDAVRRLGRERWALEALAGLDGAPELLDYFVAADHHFLVMEHIDAVNLWVWMARRHPMVVGERPGPEEYAAYTRDALDILDRTEKVIADFHGRGVAFGDLHFGNVMVRDDGTIALIDYECAFDAADTEHIPALATMGFSAASGRSGAAIDHYCLASLKLALFLPLEKIRAFAPDKAQAQLALVAERFPLPDGFVEDLAKDLAVPERPAPTMTPMSRMRPAAVDLAAASPDWSAARASMAQAIAASADPSRTDRLFPGDSEQFTLGGETFAHGAAGVLWALSTAGFPIADEHRAWLLRAARRERPRHGFHNGSHGVAFTLDHLGHPEAARKLLTDIAEPARHVRTVGLYDGLAGIGLNQLHLARRWDTAMFDDDISRTADALAAALAADRPLVGGPPGSAAAPPLRAGLMHGWSGVALFFLRLFEAQGRTRHLDLAFTALHRDLDRCVRTDGGSLQVEDPQVRTLAYVDVGSAGIALVADEALLLGDDDRVRAALPGLLSACTVEMVLQPQLFAGRAGLLATLERCVRRDPAAASGAAVRRHLARLDWHALSYQGHLAFPGDFSLKLSMDLATGTAGVLLATTTATSPTGSFLPFFSDRPAVVGD